MEEKSKSILGSRGRKFFFTKTEQHKIIQEYLTTCSSKQAIWSKYTGESVEHGQILRWMRQLGYRELSEMDEIPEIEIKPDEMTRRKKKKPSEQDNQEPEFLKRRITLLEYRLREAELKATAYSTMIDIAEKELKISIRKK